MATLIRRASKKDGKALYTVQFTLSRRRPCVPLGNMTKAQAQEVKGHIESLASARRSNLTIAGRVADWLSDVDDGFFTRLVEAGLRSTASARADTGT